MAQPAGTPPKPEPMPFNQSTPGDGGVPKGRISKGPRDNPAGGRHSGALLADPLQTLEKAKLHRGAPTGHK